MEEEFNSIMELQKLVDKYKSELENRDLIIKKLKQEIQKKDNIILIYSASLV